MLAPSQHQALTCTPLAPNLYPATTPCFHPPEPPLCAPRPRDRATRKAVKCPTPTAKANVSMNTRSIRVPRTAIASNQSRRAKDYTHHQYNVRPYPHDSLPPNFATLIAITSIPPLKKPRPPSRLRPHQTLSLESHFDATEVSEKIDHYAPPRKDHLDILLGSPHTHFNLSRVHGIEAVPSLSSSLSTQDSSPAQKLTADDFLNGCIATPETKPGLGRASSRLKPQSCRLEDCLPTHDPLSDLANDGKTAAESSSTSQVVPRLSLSPVQHEPKTQSTLYAPFRAMKAATRKLTFATSHSSTSREVQTKPSLRHTYTAAFMAEDFLRRLQDTSTQTFSKYSNPFRHDPLEEYCSMSMNHKTERRLCISSIQLQTYHTSRSPRRIVGLTCHQPTKNTTATNALSAEPLARPREMRENGDFMRVAVMEMLMRKRGKLDRQSPGRARMALPPRKVSTEPYEISPDGVPIRWLPISCESIV